MFQEKKKFMEDFELRGVHHLPDFGFGESSSTSARFRFSGDCPASFTPVSNPFANRESRRNLSTTRADINLGKSLSKMSISDEDEKSFFTGSHPPFLGSENLHELGAGSSLEASTHRQGRRLMQSSHGQDGDSGRLRLLAREDNYPNHRGGFIENTSRLNIDYYFLAQQQTRRRHIAECMKEALSPNLESMLGIYGSVYSMAKDQMGCRFLQKLIEEGSFLDGSFLDAFVIFRGLIDDVVELGMDQFGNFLIQKLIQVCNEQQRTQILIKLTSTPGLLIDISLHNYGTRVVQKVIETVRTKTEINMVKSALKPGLLSLVRDVNGNHVIQSCLKFLAPEDKKFILEGATRFCDTIATHKYGCCVMQLCVKYSDGAERENLVAEIAGNSLHLAQDPFGNYVVQYIIEQNLGGVDVMFELRGSYVKLATQKFSSHVVEKCLRHYPESRSQIVRELISDPHFERLLQDPFANYVILSALSKTKGYVRASLEDKIRTFGYLSLNPSCKRIFSKIGHLRK